MISDGYSATLKKLISFTQAKFIALADVVGYDVSYVNKWSNGTKLPSSRYVERINEDMGQYFAELIVKQKKKDKFFKSFPIPEHAEDLGFEISQYLCSAYRTTLHQNRAPKSKENRPSIKVVTGHHKTVNSWYSANSLASAIPDSGNISKDFSLKTSSSSVSDWTLTNWKPIRKL